MLKFISHQPQVRRNLVHFCLTYMKYQTSTSKLLKRTLNNITKASQNSESVHTLFWLAVILLHHVAFFPWMWTEKLPVIWILSYYVRLEHKTNKKAIARARQNWSILHKSGRIQRFRKLLRFALVTHPPPTLTFRWASLSFASFHSPYSFSVMRMNRTFETTPRDVLKMRKNLKLIPLWSQSMLSNTNSSLPNRASLHHSPIKLLRLGGWLPKGHLVLWLIVACGARDKNRLLALKEVRSWVDGCYV